MLKKLVKGIKSLAKSAAPLIGMAAPILFPGTGFMGGALAGGLASLVGGSSPKEALRNALFSGAGAKFVSPGVTQYKAAAGEGFKKASEAGLKALFDRSMTDKLAIAGALAGAGALAEPPQPETSVLDAEDITGKYGTLFDFQEDLQNPILLSPGEMPKGYATGGQVTQEPRPVEQFPRMSGYIDGPGTETSDDIPAMLSKNEFVMTAKAVRGLGTLLGANNKEQQIKLGTEGMYGIMDRFSRQA